MENTHLKTRGRSHESGLGLNVIEATRFSREDFDKINAVAAELKMTRSEVIRRSVRVGLQRFAKIVRKTMAFEGGER